MKQILSQTIGFSLVMPPQNYERNAQYRKCIYTIALEYKDNILLFNTLTREMLSLDKSEYENIDNNHTLKEQLVAKYFLVEQNFDEKKLSQQISAFAKTLDRNKAITKFVIFPTMDCNARCFYCFEHGAKRNAMSAKTAMDTADFIIKKANGKKVSIQWFGGEPLYNIDAIDIISKHLNENNIEFSSIMISNGYLLDEKTALHAKEAWNLKRVQITLDGTKDIYNKIKNYIYKPNDDAFDRVISNIETALKNNIKITIRLNMDKDNQNDLCELTKYLCVKFKGYENLLSIYVWLLYDNRGAVKRIKSDEERCELTEHLLKLEDYIYERGFGLKGGPNEKITVNMCLADSDSSITVLPDGKIGKCDHYSDEKLIGDIYDEVIDTDVINMWKQVRDEVDLCAKCPLYPQCIKLKNCPEMGTFDCDAPEQKRLLSKLHHQMRYAYDKTVE